MWRKNCPFVVIQRFFAAVCFLLLAICCQNTVAKDINVLVGSSIDLPCTVDTEQCGELHSVKWYRDTSRIYVYSQLGLISRAEGNATKRITVEYQLNNTEALLRINKVELLDEASYKCEITYLEVRENCDVVQIIRLQTMVQPDPPRILSTSGSQPLQGNIANTTLGPYEEDTQIELICQATGGKPKPQVKWYNGSQEMNATYEPTQDTDGLFTETAKLNIRLTRGDLKARYECRVTSDALQQPMMAYLDMEVLVKPLYMKLEYQEQVVQGNDVLLICDVFGANPAADVKWFNNSKLITNESLVHTVPEAMPIFTKVEDNRNGTFTTKSQLQFKASRFDNGQIFHCYAENSVIRNKTALFHKQVLIQVKYAPVVSVSPENTTTNETSQNILIGCRYTANPLELKAVYWMKNGKNLTLNKEKYEGGTALHPPLIIKNVTRDDMGEYVCVCMNDVGISESENSAYLNVQYPPTVEVIMDPETPVKAVDGVNVTAMCNVVAGNPPTLLKVRWFLGQDLLKELPECNYTSNDVDGYGGLYCNVDPSILSLVTVDQSFAGNYTCRGMNVYDWGSQSQPTELVVHYPPSGAKLTYTPSKVIKRGQVDLHCSVEHEGRPKNLTYIWYRGIHKMSGETSSKLTINPVKLDTRNNFTCMASNEGGISDSATVFINVSAPPAFITPLTYQHVRSFQQNMSLTCRVECSPLCYISWFKENEQIDTRNTKLYDIKTTIRDANGKTGDFESIESTLIWNVDAWPTHPFAKTAPTVHYMCISSSNEFGNGVNASVPVEVEYPPENLTLSNYTISVVEGKYPPEVICTGKGFPHLYYFWRRQNSSKILSYTQALTFETPVTKSDSGGYVCEANNTHGSTQIVLKLEVKYPPQCVITKGEYNGNPALLCIVDANPDQVTFAWKIQGANDTIDEQLNTRQEGVRGFLLLHSGVETLRTYQCSATNSAGTGNRCIIDVTGEAARWWHIFGTGSNVILILIIVGIILCAIFVCIVIIIIICVCKRRRARNKLPNQSIIADRDRLGGHDGLTDPLTPEKGFYENLPFHGIQTPPNKPISIITPFMKNNARSVPNSLNPPLKVQQYRPIYNAKPNSRIIRPVQRHQSFHGFGTGGSCSFIIPQTGELVKVQPQMPAVLYNLPQNAMGRNMSAENFAINRYRSVSNFSDMAYQNHRVIGRREQMKVGELENLKKYLTQNVNKRSIDTLKSTQTVNVNEKRFGSLELKKHKCYSPTFYSMRCKKHSKRRSLIYALPKQSKSNALTKTINGDVHETNKSDTFENLSDSIQIMEQNNENNSKQISLTATPKPAPRCKRHRKNSCHVYENVSSLKGEVENLDSSNNSSENGVEISVTEALVHTTTTSDNNTDKNPNPTIPKMPLIDNWTPSTLANTNQNAFYTLTTPHYKHVTNPQISQQYAATIPHQKHMKLLPKALFQDQQISKSKSFSSRTKQKKHFQIPLQKCHSFKFQTAESYFQPIKNVHEENLMRNGYVSDFGPGYNEREHSRSHKRDKYKSKGPLVLRRPGPDDYQENSNELHNMLQLQYPQPLYSKNKSNTNRPNGIVYADLDMPKSSNSSNKKGAQVNSPLTQLQKTKPKTEYATLNFNEVGKEIDV